MDQDVYSAIHKENKASRFVFEKIGATPISNVYCIATENAWIACEKFLHT